MGLTHSWLRPTELPAEAFAAAVADIARVFQLIGVPLAGFEGHGDPILRDDVIVFNGVGGASCEPFEIHSVEFDRQGRDRVRGFCNTAGLPYDRAAMVALVALHQHLGGALAVSSDQPDDAWNDARELVSRVLGFGWDFSLSPKA